jgi:hypothetical protein
MTDTVDVEEYEEIEFKLPKRIFVIIGILLLTTVIGAGSAFYFYKKSVEVRVVSNERGNPVVGSLDTLPDILNAVGRLMILPEGEEPTFATVSDPSQLAKQQFFQKAEVGDKVLMYTKSKRAILYSPKKNKIIEVGVVVLGDNPASFEPGISTEQRP